MKFLLVCSMLFVSLFANANDKDVKCWEKDNGRLDLAYIIKPWDHNAELYEKYKLLDCRNGNDPEAKNCNFRGILKKVERQDESCLVLKHDDLAGYSWSLCREEQETMVENRLVPVTVTDDRQEGRVYCERSILHIL